ncbi:MAG: 7TM diverse intracellular signaling domain-containing protein [Desulfobacterales bacterium]|jgi:PAS domain S-box-containing protein
MARSNISSSSRLIALSLIIAYIIFFSACLNDATRRISPKAVNGILDLSDWDFKKDGPVDLSGEYEFYWSQHLTPLDFSKAPLPEKTGFIKVPGYWKDETFNGKKFPGQGYVTYRLNIQLNEQTKSLALRLLEISTAYNIFVNGQKVGALGAPSNSLETTIAQQFPQIINFKIKTNRMELIFQVSNFHHRRGGLWEIIQLGREKDLLKAQQKRLSFDLFLCGSILIMALYHLGLFCVRKKDRSSLYFSIFCFLIALRLLTTGGRYLILLFPDMSYELMIKLEYLSFYLAVPAFGLFLQSIFPKFSKRIRHLIIILGIAFSCVVIFTPTRIFSYTLNAYEMATLITIIYGLYVIFASLPKMRIEAFVFLIGFFIFLLAVLNDMLHVERIIQTGFYVPFGLFAFILSQAFLLSYRFSTALTTVETQQKELRDTFESYKTEIIDRVQAEEALRESEEKYRTILHSIQEAYYEVDLAGNLTFFNDSLRRHLGYSKKELMGMNNRQFTSKDNIERVYKTFNSVYNTGKPATALDWEMIAKDGSKKFVELSVSLMRDSDGRPVGFRGVARDITERKIAEEQAKLHQQQLMQASKMVALGTLVSGVAHEINNPNNFIMLNSPILKEAWENAMPILETYYEENGDFIVGGMKFSEMRENIPALFTGISDGSKRIKRIVDDLKNYVRDDTADLTQTVDINAVLKSAVSLLANLLKNATHKFSVAYGKNLPLLKGNFQRLEQVMINLIQNACQALSNNDKGIFISTANDNQQSNIVITIRDEGVGMPPETVEHIMDPFFTTKHDTGGIGLGLSISSRIVEEHGGTLRFSSEPGVGTTATITLPIDREKHTVEGNPE